MNQLLQIAGHCIHQSIRHPRTDIKQVANPRPINASPIPWWGSVGILIVGIASWVCATCIGIAGLDEAARAMVYIPLGNIFGMTLQIQRTMNDHDR
jgi:hypothetical protein